eukprot:TRINITY_DN6711_c1_g6_i1.p1 TRINITY_DN6711_c1_g6~~TRINITY_DN6711_c1_g6_i1.p1  ORF type:complete len:478 (+),score=175.55 TRINITY_DN6711_c1_g6_i1:903-2336(+)
MDDLAADMMALRQRKTAQNEFDMMEAYNEEQRILDAYEEGEGTEGVAAGGAARNLLDLPASLSAIIEVSHNQESWELAKVELRGPFLVWQPQEFGELGSGCEKLTMIGAEVSQHSSGDIGITSSNNEGVVLRLSHMAVTHHSSITSSQEEWVHSLTQASRLNRRANPTHGGNVASKSAKMVCNYRMSDFELVELLGKGSYGCVYRAEYKPTGRHVALKKASFTTSVEATREQSILLDMDCPFVLKAEGIFSDAGKPCTVMPLLEGGDLNLHLGLMEDGCFPPERARFHAAEILCGLDYIHSRDLVYRDLKPENVVLDAGGHTVLTDMGHARPLTNTGVAQTFCGTTEYLAPEILNWKGYTKAVDHWALGVLVYEMITGSLPFGHEKRSDEETYNAILTANPLFPPSMNPVHVDLISRLLEKHPDHRPSSDEIRQHAFFAGVDWTKTRAREVPPPYVPSLEVVQLERQQLLDAMGISG